MITVIINTNDFFDYMKSRKHIVSVSIKGKDVTFDYYLNKFSARMKYRIDGETGYRFVFDKCKKNINEFNMILEAKKYSL